MAEVATGCACLPSAHAH